jgi:exopolysaccharide production protein ExoZ
MADGNAGSIRVGSLDSLRGIAILLVITAHTSAFFDCPAMFRNFCALVGNLGVQLFFIVSAYTMCMMWHGREGEDRRLEKFYIRRFCRIAVPYWIAMILYSRWTGWTSAVPAPMGILTNATFLHGFFPSAINSIVPGGWSIADEVNFYAVFPLLIRFNPVQTLAVGLAWYLFVAVGISSYLMAHGIVDDGYSYVSLLTQLPVFLIGMVSYEFGRRRSIRTRHMAVLATLWIAIAFLAKHYGLSGRPFFWAEIMAMAITVWLIVHLGANLRLLSYIGRRSFSMYLVHFCVLRFVVHFLPAHTPWIPGFLATVSLATITATIGQKTAETWGQALGKWLVARLPVHVEPQAVVVGTTR